MKQGIERATAYKGGSDLDVRSGAKVEMREWSIELGWRKRAESWNKEASRISLASPLENTPVFQEVLLIGGF